MVCVSADPRMDAARIYIGLGWHIFVLGADKMPLPNCGSCPKHGAVDANGVRHNAEQCDCLVCHGFYAATRDLTRIEMMLARNPSGLLAARTGTASGIIVIDGEGYSDNPNLPTGVEVMDDWASWMSTSDDADGWELPQTLSTITTKGGVHKIYRMPPDAYADNGAVRSHTRVLPGVDIKAEGGYVALPPGAERSWQSDPALTPLAVPHPKMMTWLRAARGRGRNRETGPHSRTNDPTIRLVPGAPIVRSGQSGVYDFDYCREHGAPSGMRDEFVNETLFRLRRAGVPVGMAENAMRDVYVKMEQPPGNEYTWQMILDKIEHVWQTVQTDEDERRARQHDQGGSTGSGTPSTGPRGPVPTPSRAPDPVEYFIPQPAVSQSVDITVDAPGPSPSADDFASVGSGLASALAAATAAAMSGTATTAPDTQVDEDGHPLDVPDIILHDVPPSLAASHGVDELNVIRATPLATLQVTQATVFDPNHPHINTDRVNGEELAAFMYGRVIFTGTEKTPLWMVYDGRRWVEDNEGVYRLMVREYSTLLRHRATSGTVTDDEAQVLMDRARSLDTRSTMMSALNCFTAPLLARRLDTMDTSPWLLNCPNGTLDLRTGELRPHNSLDFITRICPTPFDPEARDAVWERVLFQAMGNDQDKIRLFMRFVGYTLTGDTRAKRFMIAHGVTNTGKSTVTEPVFRMLGDVDAGGYATVWEASVVQYGSQTNHAEKLAKSRAARMVLVGELDEGARLKDGFVKNYTGGDTVDGRALYKSSFSFRPQGKLWFATNYVPGSTDPAVHARMLILPFTHAPAKKDPKVKYYLDNDPRSHRAILAWAVKSCLAWQQEDTFGVTPWLRKSIATYVADSDVVLQFIEALVVETTDSDQFCTTDAMYNAWRIWALDNNVHRDHMIGSRAFHKRLVEKYGWYPGRKKNMHTGVWSRVWTGKALKS